MARLILFNKQWKRYQVPVEGAPTQAQLSLLRDSRSAKRAEAGQGAAVSLACSRRACAASGKSCPNNGSRRLAAASGSATATRARA